MRSEKINEINFTTSKYKIWNRDEIDKWPVLLEKGMNIYELSDFKNDQDDLDIERGFKLLTEESPEKKESIQDELINDQNENMASDNIRYINKSDSNYYNTKMKNSKGKVKKNKLIKSSSSKKNSDIQSENHSCEVFMEDEGDEEEKMELTKPPPSTKILKKNKRYKLKFKRPATLPNFFFNLQFINSLNHEGLLNMKVYFDDEDKINALKQVRKNAVVFFSNAFRTWLREDGNESILDDQLKRAQIKSPSLYMYLELAEKYHCGSASSEEISFWEEFHSFLDFSFVKNFSNLYFVEKTDELSLFAYYFIKGIMLDPWNNYQKHKIFEALLESIGNKLDNNQKENQFL